MPKHLNQLRDFSSLFSRSEIYNWFNNDFKSIDCKLSRYNLLEKNKGNSYLTVLKNTYKVLKENYPNEYILKNEFLNKWLRLELGNSKSILFNEFRIGKAIADLAMFNGVSKVFEIKTILDKEYRLSSQLLEYKKLFNEVYIVVPKCQITKYSTYDNNIGIITYDSDSEKFELVRKSNLNLTIDINVLMEVLHTHEYIKIVKKYYTDVPELNAFNQFEICKNLLSKIPSTLLNKLFIDTVKGRNRNNFFFNKLNNEFNQICLSLNLNKLQRDNLINQLKLNKV